MIKRLNNTLDGHYEDFEKLHGESCLPALKRPPELGHRDFDHLS